MKNEIKFSPTCAAMSGVESASRAGRYCCVKFTDGTKLTMAMSFTGPFKSWTSFSLADAAVKYAGRRSSI